MKFRPLWLCCVLIGLFTHDLRADDHSSDLIVTLLFTNDIESAYEPVPAFWRDDISRIGGIAELATLLKHLRATETNAFLFDSGDIFTGALSRKTDGELMFEFMNTMDYDAMAIGNHEFDYGHEVLLWQKNRVQFPVLGANLFYKGTDIPFSPPHAVIERNGIRIGVIGVLGQDAATTAVAPRHIKALDVTDPAEAVRRSVNELKDDVDVVVVLAHQGHTAPMQTDAEADPRLQRDIQKDIDLAGSVEGIHVLFGGHADAGTPEPVVQPETGTLIMQTYGQATYVGYLRLVLDSKTKETKSYEGKLIPVESDKLIPDPTIVAKYKHYSSAHPEITKVVGRSEARLNRKYFDESDLGNLLADILKESTGADVGLMHPGGIRNDLPQGDVTVADILDVSPFVDPVMMMSVNGKQLRDVLEQSLTLLRGLMQVSGLEVEYDVSRPERQRLLSVKYKGKELSDSMELRVAVSGIIARGGDHYEEFLETKVLDEYEPLSEHMLRYFDSREMVMKPMSGRQIDRTK